MIVKNKYIFELDEKEKNIFLQTLNYCYHRLKKHKDSGISTMVNINDVDKLRKEIK